MSKKASSSFKGDLALDQALPSERTPLTGGFDSSSTGSTFAPPIKSMLPAAVVARNARPKPPRTFYDTVSDWCHWTIKTLIMTLLFVTGLMVNVFQVTNIILFFWWNKALFRKGSQLIDFFYGNFLISILEGFSGLSTTYYGDMSFFSPKLQLDSVIYISNHTSYADWPVFFGAAYRRGANQYMKVFLKDVAAYIPGIGWACAMSEYFLVKKSKSKGDWARDGQVIVDRLRSFKDSGSKIWATIFPEGTFHDRADETLVERTKKFALENNLPVYNYLLNPRPRGFASCVQNLRGHATHVVDLTLTFIGNVSDSPQVDEFVGALPLEDTARVLPDASDCCAFRGPSDLHVHVRLHELSEVPDDEEGIKLWLAKVYQDKEQLMHYFHQHGAFPGTPKKDSVRLFWGGERNWMIRYPLFWFGVMWVFQLLLRNLPARLLQMGGLTCLVTCVLGILIQMFCKQR